MHSARHCWHRASRYPLSTACKHVRAQHAQAGSLNAITNTAAPSNAEEQGRLAGKNVAIKDNITTSSLLTTAASGILATHVSPFEATVVRLLRQNGATITSTTNLDEFGMGSHSQHSVHGPVLSPFTRDGIPLSPGGSSGGSAVAVASGQCWTALGTDTGGSVRLPAAYVGVVGFKPSYGLLSRWGVVQYANSLDTVGVLARRVGDVREVFEVMNQHDARDPTSLPDSVRQRITSSSSSRQDRKGTLRIGIPLDYNITSLAPSIRKTYTTLLTTLQSQGHTLHPIHLPTTRLALSAYYVLAPAEASSNLAKYDGIRYGQRSTTATADASPAEKLPLYAATRAEGFGEEVKRRILLGTYTLMSEARDNYFLQAQKVRRLVQRDFDRVFAAPNLLLDADGHDIGEGERKEDVVDVLLTPTAPTLPPTVEEVKRSSPVESYMNDVFTVPASLAGLPAASVPVALPAEVREALGEGDVRSVGMQVIGQFGDDELVLRAVEAIENLH